MGICPCRLDIVIRVCNKYKPWLDDQCMLAFGVKQEALLRRTCDSSRVKGTLPEVIRFSSFFLIVINNCYGIANNV